MSTELIATALLIVFFAIAFIAFGRMMKKQEEKEAREYRERVQKTIDKYGLTEKDGSRITARQNVENRTNQREERNSPDLKTTNLHRVSRRGDPGIMMDDVIVDDVVDTSIINAVSSATFLNCVIPPVRQQEDDLSVDDVITNYNPTSMVLDYHEPYPHHSIESESVRPDLPSEQPIPENTTYESLSHSHESHYSTPDPTPDYSYSAPDPSPSIDTSPSDYGSSVDYSSSSDFSSSSDSGGGSDF